MLGKVARALAEGTVIYFAALAFFLVPVGRKTPAQHLAAIFTTAPAREAASAFAGAARRAVARAGDGITALRDPRSSPPRPP